MPAISVKPEPVFLIIEEPAGIDRREWPVTQGIPFPDQTLTRNTPVVILDPAGNPLPTQVDGLATWNADRRYVKWLLVDFPASLPAHSTGRFQLVHGAEIRPPSPAHPVCVTDSGASVSVSNDRIELVLHRGTADFFQGLRLLPPDAPPIPVLTAQRRPHLHLLVRDKTAPTRPPIECASDRGPLAPLIEVEAAGPLRASLLVRGYHFSPDGLRLCPYRLRIHLHAGQAEVGIEHTLILDQDPDRFALASFALRWPLGACAPRHAWVGDESQPRDLSASAASFGFRQTAADAFTMFDDRSEVATGRQAPGWIARTGPVFSLAAGLNETWRDYPVGLRFTPEALSLDFWPAEAGPLDFASPFAQPSHWIRESLPLAEDELKHRLEANPSAPLDLHFARLGEGPPALDRCDQWHSQIRRLALGRPYAFSNTDIAGACGTAKTHRAWIRFFTSEPNAPALDNLSRSHREPLLALPDPAYVCASGAVRLLHPRDPARFPAVEQALTELFDRLVLEPEGVCGLFGKFDHGELINGHTVNGPIAYRAFRRQPDPAHPPIRYLGVFNNESQDVIRQLWCFYLRTGRRDYFRAALAKSRHTEDVDFVHRLPRDAQVHPFPNYPDRCEGQMHYHSATHWSGPYVTSHSLVSGIATHYYLTGERRAREVALAMADNLVRNQTPNGLVREGGLHREVTGAASILLEAYQLTWAEPYRVLALNTLRMLRATAHPTGNLPSRIFTGRGPDGLDIDVEGTENRTGYPGGMLWYVLHDALAVFGETWIRDWILQLAEAWIQDIPCDDVIPADRARPAKKGLPVHEIAPGWLWHSWMSFPNFFFDPLIALAWKLTRDPRFLGYLVHRTRVFPDMARDAARCFTGHAFNALNHCGEAVPSLLGVLAEAGEERCQAAYALWKSERQAKGFPVYEGPTSGFDDVGMPQGALSHIDIHLGPLLEQPTDAPPPGRTRRGRWNPVQNRFESDL